MVWFVCDGRALTVESVETRPHESYSDDGWSGYGGMYVLDVCGGGGGGGGGVNPLISIVILVRVRVLLLIIIF